MQRGRSGRSFIALHTATCDRQPIPQSNAGRSLNQMRGAFSMRGTFSTFPIATGFLWLYSGITRYITPPLNLSSARASYNYQLYQHTPLTGRRSR